jgi:apolipoprotein D and lipocalin family protein
MPTPRRRRLPYALSRTIKALGITLGLCAAAGPTAAAADPLPTVPHVDLARYAGTWHEIARLPNWFQRSCERSHAEYTPCGDGTLKVVNTCVKASGRYTSIEGRATPVPCSGNARLRVKFGGLAAFVPVAAEGNYFVIALDDDYQWALVGTPDRRFLWILARQPQLDPGVYAQLTRQACCLGFDVGSLVTACR